MPIRTVKPTSPARRYLTYVRYDEITKTEPEKRLLSPKHRTGGRNSYGRITTRHRGGGAKRYIIAPHGVKVDDVLMSGPQADILPGNALRIRNIPVGTMIHNVELHVGRGGQMCRSAGSQAQLLAKEGDDATLKLPSGETRLVSVECMATVG